jgi:hypothetical protein
MLSQGSGNLQLGADSVNAGYQNRLLVALKFKKPAKEPDAGQDLRAEGRAGMLLNQLLSLGGNININPSRSVGFTN